MAKVFILLGIFILVVYVYSIKKIKATKEKTGKINSVQEFHNNYQYMSAKKQIRKNQTSGDYCKYITKYNSSEDYREKS